MTEAGIVHPPIDEGELEREVQLAFAPLHKFAFGAATATVGALLMLLLTLAVLLTERARDFPLGLLSQYFAGYRIAPSGLVIGAAWGGFTGFVVGWFVAFCRNLVLAIGAFWIRARAELDQTSDFLDHI